MNKFWVKLICFFIPVRKYRKQLKNKLMANVNSGVASLICDQPKGNVLISYMKDSALLDDRDERLMYHTNRWENREIARIFYEMGYNVDCIDFNRKFIPQKQYDIMLDIEGNFTEYAEWLKPNALKIMHLTGSYGPYNNKQEAERLAYLHQRQGIALPVERVFNADMDEALENADVCSLIGNEWTMNTYPQKFYDKIHLIGVTGSLLSKIKSEGDYYPQEKEFLWMGGAGPVHKGLDILLDIFAKHPEWTLNIMAKINPKSEFYKVYKKELIKLPNIHFHGLIMPCSEKFNQIVSRCFAFVNPSCAEGMSTATVTALSAGLYPIISYANGFTLPDKCGIYLDKCSVMEIEAVLDKVWNMDKDSIVKEIMIVQKYTLENFSREAFRKNMESFITAQINNHNKSQA